MAQWYSLPANAEMQETRDDPLEKKWQCPTVFLPRESCEQRSLVGYSSWRHRESDMTEHTQYHGAAICAHFLLPKCVVNS